MDVKVVDYDSSENENYVIYKISNLPLNQLEYLNNNLEDETVLKENYLILKIYYEKEIFPFNSEASKLKLEDYIARDEIEMNVFLSSYLENFKPI